MLFYCFFSAFLLLYINRLTEQEGWDKRANVGLDEKHASGNIPNSFILLISTYDLKKKKTERNRHFRLKDFVKNVVCRKWKNNYYQGTIGFAEDLKQLNQQPE